MNFKQDEPTIILMESEVKKLLEGKDLEVLSCVKQAYMLHEKGQSILPHSVFLKFSENNSNRIIALPSHLKSNPTITGIKWVSSFPENIKMGLPRASATLILNSAITGYPIGIFSAASISAKRTAASAALAAQILHKETPNNIGIVGCGVIAFECLNFLKVIYPDLKQLKIMDISETRAGEFFDRCNSVFPDIKIEILKVAEAIIESADVIIISTTASQPFIEDIPPNCRKIILDISLRDLHPSIIKSSYNIVDDREHVCRAQTSIHLTLQESKSDDFISATLGEILLNQAKVMGLEGKPIIFSPFGLGILDLAVANYVMEQAIEKQIGLHINNFAN